MIRMYKAGDAGAHEARSKTDGEVRDNELRKCGERMVRAKVVFDAIRDVEKIVKKRQEIEQTKLKRAVVMHANMKRELMEQKKMERAMMEWEKVQQAMIDLKRAMVDVEQARMGI